MYETVQSELGPKLSKGASISSKAPTRWSAYGAPKPVTTVYVDNEEDIAATVKYCNSKDLRYLARNGGNGWVNFPETENLVMISLQQLNKVIVAEDKKTAVIGGGANVKETVDAAEAAGVMIMTGNCNGVGMIGSFLGGGLGATMGMFGYGVDSMLDMRVVTADGELRTVSETKEPDLWWAMRGAGPNFGIVASATVKAHAMPKEERSAWKGVLIFTDDKLEQVFQALEELKLSDRMVILAYVASSGPPTHAPALILEVWLIQGTVEAGREAFKSVIDIGPVVDQTGISAYPDWNEGEDMFCTHGGRKPCYAAGFSRLDPKVWRQIWNSFTNFQKRPGAQQSAVLLEMYPMSEIPFAGEKAAAAAHRHTRLQALFIGWYDDPSLDDEAEKTGKEIRELMRSCRGEKDMTYINLANGDEKPEEVYGESLPRLKELKRQWDPENKLNQWYTIPMA